MQDTASTRNKYIVKNVQAFFNYEIIDTFQAGIVLSGPEVKSVKNKRISLKGSYIRIENNEAWLINCSIAPYGPAKGIQQNYQQEKPRKLLLHKKEISELIGKSKQKGLTIMPTCVYTKRGLIKVDIALARGKTKIDKREKIKDREIQRQISRSLKNK